MPNPNDTKPTKITKRSNFQIDTSVEVLIVVNNDSKDTALTEETSSRCPMKPVFSPKDYINPKYSERRKFHDKRRTSRIS